MNFLNNMSKNTTDVVGAIIAVIIFWVAVQYFIDPDVPQEHNGAPVEMQKKVNQ